MFAKRPSDSKKPAHKHSGAVIEEKRSMATLADARRERLQMLSLVPDDVLRMVRDFVCHLDDDDGLSIARTLPLMYMLGAPFAPPELRLDVTSKVAQYLSMHVDHAVAFVRDMKAAAVSLDLCVNIGGKLRRALPQRVSSRNARTLITIALEGKLGHNEVNKCSTEHQILCMLLATPGADVATAVGIDPRQSTLAIALRSKLWHKADALTRAPYNQTVGPRVVSALFRAHAKGSIDIPIDLLHRLVAADTAIVRILALNLLTRGMQQHFEWLVAHHAASIDGDHLLTSCDIYHPASHRQHGALQAQMLASALPRLATSSQGHTTALAMSLHKSDIMQPVIDWLLSQPYSKIQLCIALARRGDLALAEPYLATLDGPNDVRDVLDAYIPSPLPSLESDVAIMTRLPAVNAHLPDSLLLDRLIMDGCVTPASGRAALAAGMKVHDSSSVLAYLLGRRDAELARVIITNGSFTGDELTGAIVFVAQQEDARFDSPDVVPALETGLVDVRRLLVGLCATEAVQSRRVMEQIGDFYRTATDPAFTQRPDDPVWW